MGGSRLPGGWNRGPGGWGPGKARPAGAGAGTQREPSGNPTEAGQVGGRAKRAEMPPSAGRPGKKRCGPTQKKRRHERSIVRAGRPVTQLVSTVATHLPDAGRRSAERISLYPTRIPRTTGLPRCLGRLPDTAGPVRTAVQPPEPARPALRRRAIAASCAVMPPASCDTNASFTRL